LLVATWSIILTGAFTVVFLRGLPAGRGVGADYVQVR
jgi:hypothetical protein